MEIRNTKLQNLGFLEFFMMIVSLNETQSVLQVIGNKDLSNSTMGRMTDIYTRGRRDAIFQDNHPDIFQSTNGSCNIFGVDPDERIMFRRRLNYTGGDCDPKCVFNYTEITSKTLKYFPKCKEIYGIIHINENTDVTVTQLEKTFDNVTKLTGGIRIENSKLTSISFLNDYTYFHCATYGLYILNNSLLTNISVLPTLYFYTDEMVDECTVEIRNNSKLDLTDSCLERSFNDLSFMKSEGNLKDCGCDGEKFFLGTVNQFNDCQNVYNGMKISNLSSSQFSSALSSVSTFRGFLGIQNTDIVNMSFLESLEKIQTNTRNITILNLQNNQNMTRLAFPKLKEITNINLYGMQYFNFENLHPDFCVTLNEFKLLFEEQISFIKLHTKLCELTDAEKNGVVAICYFKSMEELDNNCGYIIGDIKVNSGDEDHTTKMLRVRYLFGSLSIQNTALTDLSFLSKLVYIVNLDDTRPVIQIIGNKNLTNPKIGSVANLYTREKREAIIQDNHPAIFNSTNGTCNVFGEVVNTIMMYRRRLNYTGGDCGARVELTSSFQGDINSLLGVILTITVLGYLK